MAQLAKFSKSTNMSWTEVEDMVEQMAMSLSSNPIRVDSIWYNNHDSLIPSYLLSKLLRKPLKEGGLIFGLNDYNKDVDICFHHIEFPSEHFSYKPKVYLFELDGDIEGRFQNIEYPWQK